MSADPVVVREVILEVLERHFGPVAVAWEWKWRAVAFGPCPRCRWLAHTLAPNGVPFHAYCWRNGDPVSDFERWLYRQAQAGAWSP
jgi:hypothetical protein